MKNLSAQAMAAALFNAHLSIQSEINWTNNVQLKDELIDFNEKNKDEVDFYWKELAKKSAIITANNLHNLATKHSLKISDPNYWDLVIYEIMSL